MENSSFLLRCWLCKIAMLGFAFGLLHGFTFGQFTPKGMVVGVPEPNVHLVTIGINNYEHLAPWQKGKIGNFDLRLAEKDADEIGAAFQRLGDAGNFGKVVVHPLKGYQATKAGIEALIMGLSVRGGDLLIVFFSGHGMLLDGKSYLIPQDCDPFRPSLLGIEVTSFTDMIASKGATYMALFDACNSGKGTEGKKSLSAEERTEFQKEFVKGINAPQKPGILVTSSNAFQASYEDDRIGNGVLTNVPSNLLRVMPSTKRSRLK